MKNILKIALITSLTVTSQFSFAAGDAAKGKAKSATCTACHGADGNSAVPTYPNLAGQKEAYLAKQIKDFKSGARKDATMAAMVGGLSDDDIANLAAYFATQKAK